ncbi:hypothetical protein GCM10022223_03100 [Kineosporia mesophila]|uniref:TadE-like protein n=1 Tax=Kineosporia mesophila TaxID=566012 RepID=A0ABP6YWP7_9ACTN|nr:pilus assembly protein [Kineosporia mesophila]MCD5351796.1 pilus assembly protein [Kineosporia mesophila]
MVRGKDRICASREGGSAAIEFVALGLLLMLPVAYLVLILGRVQAASFAADGAAREAVRAFITAANDTEGQERAATSAELALKDQGFAASDGTLHIGCSRSSCLVPGERVTAQVEVTASFPWLPVGLADALRAQVVVSASQVETVDEFREFGRQGN